MKVEANTAKQVTGYNTESLAEGENTKNLQSIRAKITFFDTAKFHYTELK